MSPRCVLLAVVLACQPSLAAAEEAPVSEPMVALPAIAVGVNVPWDWYFGIVGGSAYVGVNEHHAVRANFARFRADDSLYAVKQIATGFYHSAPVGTIYDVGASWVWYPRRRWDGPMLEAGVLRRDRDTVYWPEMSPKTITDSVTYSGRAMVGWSWRLGRHAFVAAAVGGAVGRESGLETIEDGDAFPEPTTVSHSVRRTRTDVETYLRVGIVLGD